jgi:aryl-alcohol dehydrogenase-like predicted oxidoreductase
MSIENPEMQYRTLGSTGVKVSCIGIGGYHLGEVKSEDEAIRIVRKAIDNGINFMDNSWDYHFGRSELRMGKALRHGYRERIFLMTKIDGRDKKTAIQQLDESMQRLEVDHIDLVQFHEVIRLDDPDRIFAVGGALEAVVEARAAGKVRHIGFTGHKSPQVHLKMLEVAKRNGFKFDTVQMPLNLMDVHFDSFQKEVLPLLVADGIGVLGMKPICAGKLMESKTVSAIDCLHYALSLKTDVVITGCDSMEILDQALEAVRSFKQLSPEQMRQLEAKTVAVAESGDFEEYKTTHEHDSTTMHPHWLGAA